VVPDILPTNTCFDDALDFITEVISANIDIKDELLKSLILVHAVCIHPDGYPYAHAWVEDRGKCIFKGIFNGKADYFAADQKEYYKDTKVIEVTKYTIMQAAALNAKHNTFGPWKPDYLALCSDKKRRRTFVT